MPHKGLKEIFSLCHYELNELFLLMNNQNKGSGHFHAGASRDFIYIIDTLISLRANIRDTPLAFEIEGSYEETLYRCKAFLSRSNGSSIPSGFPNLVIIQNEPVFTINEAIYRTLCK
ncbi:hypothetical protein EMIT0210MI2_250135 [Priestia megaterium]